MARHAKKLKIPCLEGCKRPVKALGLCATCYHRYWQRQQRQVRRWRREHEIEDSYVAAQKHLRLAYSNATTVESRLRMRRYLGELEQAQARAAN